MEIWLAQPRVEGGALYLIKIKQNYNLRACIRRAPFPHGYANSISLLFLDCDIYTSDWNYSFVFSFFTPLYNSGHRISPFLAEFFLRYTTASKRLFHTKKWNRRDRDKQKGRQRNEREGEEDCIERRGGPEDKGKERRGEGSESKTEIRKGDK